MTHDALISTLRELVALDTTSTKSNAAIITLLEAKVRALGFRTQLHHYADDNGLPKTNLLAWLGEGTPELALVGHTDCVPVDAAWTEAFTLTERDGNLYGRGSCDTKAFIACALAAAERTRGQLKKPLLLCFTADEEVGCLGAKKLVDARLGMSKRAIVGEPTQLTPVRANKGYCLAELEVHGKEGHSAYPDSGASAVFRGARFLTRLEAYAKGALRTQTDAAFEPPYSTLNVGAVQGGRAKNVIPGFMKLTLEWRPIPAQSVETVLQAVEQLRQDCIADEPAFSMDIKPLRMDRGFDTRADADVVQFLTEQSGHAPKTVSFGTEGPQMVQLGSVPVVFGPGDIRVAHQTGEFVPKAELLACADILERAVRHFCA